MTMVYFAAAALAPLLSFADITLPSGVRLRYAQQGPRTGPAVILLHGYSDSSLSFSRVMPLMPSEWRVIAPDLRGHGDSSRPASGYHIEDFADDVRQMMDALNVPTAVVVGHSMGSFVAQSLVERAPQRVTRLVLLGSAPIAANEGMLALQAEVDALVDPIDYGFVNAFQYSTVAQPVPAAFMEAAISNSRRMPAAIWKDVMRGLIAFRRALPRPALPTLVVGGDQDAVFSADEQAALAAEFPNAQFELVRGVGHTLHWEQPDKFVAVLRAFMQ